MQRLRNVQRVRSRRCGVACWARRDGRQSRYSAGLSCAFPLQRRQARTLGRGGVLDCIQQILSCACAFSIPYPFFPCPVLLFNPEMPSRKSESGDGPPSSSRRSSMRRLSSIASFYALNPFHRRRSNNTDASTAASSTSNLSLASSSTQPPKPSSLQTSSSQILPTKDDFTAQPIPTVPADLPSQRSSYICLPDDPIGGMPRSRTFSNLPLPTRARKNSAVQPSESPSRLSSVFLPSTRLPSPAMSNRKHSMSRLGAGHSTNHRIRNRMKRSDTEPLLPADLEHVNVVRSTAFKENISLSPVKPLPMTSYDNKELYGSTLPSRSYASRHAWADASDAATPVPDLSEPSHTRALRAWADHAGSIHTYGSSIPHLRQVSHASKASFSSPVYHSSHERAPSPGKPMPVQRWNSQPVLSNITNRRNSRYEIMERRLMSEVQPEAPPPPPKTPMTGEALNPGRARGTSRSSLLQQVTEMSGPGLSPSCCPSLFPFSQRVGFRLCSFQQSFR
jgi:hypothetical protein